MVFCVGIRVGDGGDVWHFECNVVRNAPWQAGITRAEDTIARIGDDQFAVILTPHEDTRFVSDFSKRIIDNIGKPFLIDEHNINISISIGISFYPSDAGDIANAIINADKAMYIAKKRGSKIEYYNVESL